MIISSSPVHLSSFLVHTAFCRVFFNQSSAAKSRSIRRVFGCWLVEKSENRLFLPGTVATGDADLLGAVEEKEKWSAFHCPFKDECHATRRPRVPRRVKQEAQFVEDIAVRDLSSKWRSKRCPPPHHRRYFRVAWSSCFCRRWRARATVQHCNSNNR